MKHIGIPNIPKIQEFVAAFQEWKSQHASQATDDKSGDANPSS